MAGLSKEEWNTLYQDYTKEIMKGINKQKQALKHDVGDTLYKQAVYNTLNGLYIQKATVDDLNDYVMSKITENACKDDEVGIKQVTKEIHELHEKLTNEHEETLDKIKERTEGYCGHMSLKDLTIHEYEIRYAITILETLEQLILGEKGE